MRKRTLQTTILFMLITIAMFLFVMCSDDNPVAPEETDYSNLLQTVVFVPDSGPPGTPVELQNLATLPDDGFWSLMIGEESVPLIKTDSSYYTIIPLIFSPSDSTWPIASVTPLDVTLYLDSTSVDTAFGMISVDSLVHADGAVDSMLTDFLNAADAIREISFALGIEDTLLQAVCMAMDEIILTGENSLSAIINGISPIVGGEALPVDLFSAILVSTGTSEMISSWSDSLQVVQAGAARYHAMHLSLAYSAEIDDEGLAYRMQMYSLLEGFSSQVIGQTALTWNKVSAVLGGAGVAFPPLGFIEFIVSFVVAELDFVFNKIAIALLPAEITSFDLDYLDHEIKTGDTTVAIVYISARNNPPNITPLDIVTQVINAMALTDWINKIGIPRSLIPSNVAEIIEGLTTWMLGVINNILGAYFNTSTMMDVSLPDIKYDSIPIHHPELIDLISPAISKIEPISGSFNGTAMDSSGKVGLMVATQIPGPNTLIHPILAGAGYSGSAFGNEYRTSNTDTVTVVPTLVLKANFLDTIASKGAGALGIYAGYLTSTNDTNWSAGIDLNLHISGGHLESSSGTTDADGYLGTIVHHDSLSSEIEVSIYAEGKEESVADTTITAQISGLIVKATFPSTIVKGNSQTLNVRAGYISSNDTTWTGNININLTVTGGTAEYSTGITDFEGNFQTSVQHDNLSDTVIIDILAQDDNGGTSFTSVRAVVDTSSSNDLLGWYDGDGEDCCDGDCWPIDSVKAYMEVVGDTTFLYLFGSYSLTYNRWNGFLYVCEIDGSQLKGGLYRKVEMTGGVITIKSYPDYSDDCSTLFTKDEVTATITNSSLIGETVEGCPGALDPNGGDIIKFDLTK